MSKSVKNGCSVGCQVEDALTRTPRGRQPVVLDICESEDVSCALLRIHDEKSGAPTRAEFSLPRGIRRVLRVLFRLRYDNGPSYRTSPLALERLRSNSVPFCYRAQITFFTLRARYQDRPEAGRTTQATSVSHR